MKMSEVRNTRNMRKNLKRLPNHAKDVVQVTRQSTMRAAWGDWVAQWPWSHFATLTFIPIPRNEKAVESYRMFKHAHSADAAKNQFAAWVRRLERRSQGFVSYFVAIERGASGRLHVHALVHAPGLSCTTLRATWFAGISDVRKYEPARGAAYYVAKEIGGNVVDYDIRRQNLPSGSKRASGT